jgi:hypothetical protein
MSFASPSRGSSDTTRDGRLRLRMEQITADHTRSAGPHSSAFPVSRLELARSRRGGSPWMHTSSFSNDDDGVATLQQQVYRLVSELEVRQSDTRTLEQLVDDLQRELRAANATIHEQSQTIANMATQMARFQPLRLSAPSPQQQGFDLGTDEGWLKYNAFDRLQILASEVVRLTRERDDALARAEDMGKTLVLATMPPQTPVTASASVIAPPIVNSAATQPAQASSPLPKAAAASHFANMVALSQQPHRDGSPPAPAAPTSHAATDPTTRPPAEDVSALQDQVRFWQTLAARRQTENAEPAQVENAKAQASFWKSLADRRQAAIGGAKTTASATTTTAVPTLLLPPTQQPVTTALLNTRSPAAPNTHPAALPATHQSPHDIASIAALYHNVQAWHARAGHGHSPGLAAPAIPPPQYAAPAPSAVGAIAAPPPAALSTTIPPPPPLAQQPAPPAPTISQAPVATGTLPAALLQANYQAPLHDLASIAALYHNAQAWHARAAHDPNLATAAVNATPTTVVPAQCAVAGPIAAPPGPVAVSTAIPLSPPPAQRPGSTVPLTTQAPAVPGTGPLATLPANYQPSIGHAASVPPAVGDPQTRPLVSREAATAAGVELPRAALGTSSSPAASSSATVSSPITRDRLQQVLGTMPGWHPTAKC